VTRTYGHFCGLARALDLVGERWSLLVVRELLVGPARYGELLAALPGIATNLLADRLRTLEAGGVVERRLRTGAPGVLYALTPWGQELEGTVQALTRWSTPLMTSGPGADQFRPHWLVVALEALLAGRRADPAVEVGLVVEGTALLVRVGPDGARVARVEQLSTPTVLRAPGAVVLGLAAGALAPAEAAAAGSLAGDVGALARVFSPEVAVGGGSGL